MLVEDVSPCREQRRSDHPRMYRATSKSKPPGPKYGAYRVTDVRRETFLKVLSETGSFAAAARAASPHSKDRHGGASTFKQLMQRDPDFAAAVEDARSQALGRLETECVRRAVEGVRRPIYQKGELVGYEDVHSDGLLMFALRALDPDKYNEKRQVELKGDVTHRVVGLMISPQDLLALNDDDRAALERIVGKIADARGEKEEQPAALPAALPGIVDAGP